MELRARGGGIRSTETRYAKCLPADVLRAPSNPFTRQWPFHNRPSELGDARRLRAVRLESFADRSAGPAMAGRNRDAEKSNIEPSGRALHRMRTRDHKIAWP